MVRLWGTAAAMEENTGLSALRETFGLPIAVILGFLYLNRVAVGIRE
ncbi:hypothetical protein H1230_27900 [Paenibacillus sp. 19GGS1-52]|nr:hypothetical protein [Paenibacillus sp. 19GGS1-52]ULO06764.1 hypothetical protein H1230_27900 [Paenibacillus sp. 19GGS1-52]